MKSKKPQNPQANGGGNPAGNPQAQCHEDPQTFELAELLEVYTEGGADKTQATGGRKQYINLKSDAEGADKTHPEYGREIVLKARVKEKSGKTDKLAGIKVVFSFTRTDGAHRTTPVTAWDTADLTDDQKEGYGGGKTATVTVETDALGWTSKTAFITSMFGGDQFEISAKLDPLTPGATGAAPKKTGKYIVWRKFWYQLSYADGFTVSDPTTAEAAYAEVFAEVSKSNEKQFTKADLPNDLQNRTFMKEYMLEQGGGDTDVAVIGSHNKNQFTTSAKLKQTEEAANPIKAHLIICEYQCDPKDASTLGLFKLTSNGQEIVVDPGTGGPIICKPSLKPGSKLVVSGEWSRTQFPWNRGGDVADESIEIKEARTSLLKVSVDLSKGSTGAPVPTNGRPVFVKLKVNTAEGFLGESFGKGQILCVYRPSADEGDQGSEEDFNNTIAHEMGHMWNQTPEPAAQPASMKNHPLQYVGHGGSGSHCRHDVVQSLKKNGDDWKVASQNADTTIRETSTVAKDTYKVLSSTGFVKGHKVTVNGVEKTVSAVVDATHLKFTTAFAAQTDHAVQQRLNYGAADWTDNDEEEPMPLAGSCLMYHSYSSRCSKKFCDTCRPYLQLQDMSTLG